jgi:hypothetical protein
MVFDRLKSGLQVRWIATAAGAVAMIIIASVLVWKLMTAPDPIAQITTRIGPSAIEH